MDNHYAIYVIHQIIPIGLFLPIDLTSNVLVSFLFNHLSPP